MTAETAFAPLPVRRRDILEIFDTALKLYRRYFWVLLAWSAIATIASAVGTFVMCVTPVLAIFTMPLMVGATACAIAAAVRGQNITFGQCWRFFKPRYWPTVGQYVLVTILGVLGLGGLSAICSIAIALVIGVMSAVAAPNWVSVPIWIIISLVLFVLGSILGSAIFCWMYMVPIIVCLEDDKRGGLAQSRAWDLLRKEWIRATMLFALIGLAFIACGGITLGFAVLLTGLDNARSLMSGTNPGAMTGFFMTISFVGAVLNIVTMPLFYLCTGVFYLDLRVRKEALDLEWNAHVSAPPEQTRETALEAPAAPAPAAAMSAGSPADIAPATFAAGAFAGDAAPPAPSPEPQPFSPVVEPTPSVDVAAPPEAGSDGIASRSVFDNPAPVEAAPISDAPVGESSTFSPAPYEPEPLPSQPTFSGFDGTPEPAASPAYQAPSPAPAPSESTPSFGVEPAEPASVEVSSFGTEPSAEPTFAPSSFGGSSFAPEPFFDSGPADTPPTAEDSGPSSTNSAPTN